jgi:hypothetical protein
MVDGNAGEPDLYWTGCRDGRGGADVRLRGSPVKKDEAMYSGLPSLGEIIT